MDISADDKLLKQVHANQQCTACFEDQCQNAEVWQRKRVIRITLGQDRKDVNRDRAQSCNDLHGSARREECVLEVKSRR